MHHKHTLKLVSLAASAIGMFLLSSAAPAAQPDRSTFQCMAASAIVIKFSTGERQIAIVRDDAEFQELSQRVIVMAAKRLPSLSQEQMMNGMNREMESEAKLMANAIFRGNSDHVLSDAEVGRQIKAHMTSRFRKLNCLASV